MKKVCFILFAAALLLVFAACAAQPAATEQPKDTAAPAEGSPEAFTAEPAETPGQTAPAETTQEPAENPTGPASETTSEPHADVLVVYFSATGTTKAVAEKIAALTGGDLYEIVPAEPYSDADLNWNDRDSRSTREQNDKSARPEIAGDPIDLTGYRTIYVGFPIWWGEEPRIMDAFVESRSFDGVTMIPFCTSASSGIGRSGQNLAENAGSGNWLDGKRFSGSVTEAELQAWIDSMK